MIFLITIQDKTLYGEPDVALAVVDVADEAEALRAARPTIEELADRGHGRCVPHARQLEPGKFYRLGAVVRVPRDPNAEDESRSTSMASRSGTLTDADRWLFLRHLWIDIAMEMGVPTAVVARYMNERRI